jgi:4-diphosphocytidyl-2-C-methyl-D-erythritol kinase
LAPGGVTVSAFAPAKINLYLHVLGRRADGYHRLDSLVAFADIGDRVTVRPADSLTLTVGGPEAAALAGLGEDNLVMRAARLLAAPAGIGAGAALHLEKQLPAAAGIGGGSSDAAAALRALAALWEVPLGEPELMALALQLGADVPACLAGRPVWVGGIGEEIMRAGALPEAGIVLANPRRPLPTAAVFQRYRGPYRVADRFDPVPSDAAGLAVVLASRHNDLTEAARELVPEIGAALDRLAALPGALLARMSGSGATCFALFADRAAALAAGKTLALAEPLWWSAAGMLTSGPAAIGGLTSGSRSHISA